MWYFTWAIGVCFAACCGIVNVLWLENNKQLKEEEQQQS